MYKLGLVVGKFCPLHIGHKYVIDTAFEQSEHSICAIVLQSRTLHDCWSVFSLFGTRYLGGRPLEKANGAARSVKLYFYSGVWYNNL
jgi:hypothetical protein